MKREPADLPEGATVILEKDLAPRLGSHEMQRRSADYESGVDPGIPWSELRARIAAKRGSLPSL